MILGFDPLSKVIKSKGDVIWVVLSRVFNKARKGRVIEPYGFKAERALPIVVGGVGGWVLMRIG